MIPIERSDLEINLDHNNPEIIECWKKFNSIYEQNKEIKNISETYSDDSGYILRVMFEAFVDNRSAGDHLFVCWKKPGRYPRSFFSTVEESGRFGN